MDKNKNNGCGCENNPPCLGCAPKADKRKPIGYMFKSSLFCPCCTDGAYESGELVRAMPPAGKVRNPPTFDENALPSDMVTTGNESVQPVFADGYPDGYTCAECGDNFPKTYLPDFTDLSAVPVDPDANRLNLYAVWAISGDTSETEKIYIMALTEEGAACLYHQSRARDHGNMLCEVMVSKIADAEVCDG